MIYIDKFANINRLSGFHPLEKAAFALITLGLILTIPSPLMYISAFLITSLLIIFYARIPAKFYFKLLMLPGYFILATALTLMIEKNQKEMVINLGFIWNGLGISRYGLISGSLVFLKSLSAISSMYFLSLTVPFIDIFYLFRKLRFPSIFLELVFLIYRFLLVMLETTDKIHTSQVCRLSQKNFSSRLKAAVKTAGALFVLSMKRYEERLNAMESRLSSGEIVFLTPDYKTSSLHIAGIIILEFFFIAMGLYIEPILLKGRLI